MTGMSIQLAMLPSWPSPTFPYTESGEMMHSEVGHGEEAGARPGVQG